MVLDEKLVAATAKEIIEAGTSYDYILNVWKRRYSGKPLIGRILLASLGSGSASNSSGIHVQVCGPAGSGKSEAARKMASLVHPSYRLVANVTPQALFYPIESFVDGSVVFIDDIVWTNELGNSVKKITSMFQDGAERVVTSDGIGKREISRKRLTFWSTSVDNHADEQMRDRQFLVECDSSIEAKKKVSKSIWARLAGKSIKEEVDFETAVCHALFWDLRSWFGEVVVPFAEEIDFPIYDNRGQMLYADLIISFAVFAKGARKFDEYCRLLATEEDHKRAKALYDDLGGHSAYKLTEVEKGLIDGLMDFGGVANKRQLQQITGLSLGRIGDLLNGTKSNGYHGLFYKCPYLSKDESVRPYNVVLSENN